MPINIYTGTSSCVPITSRLLKPAPASSSTACSFFEMMMRSAKTFNETLVVLRRHSHKLLCTSEMDIDALSEAMKAADITQEGGRGVLDENPVNLLQGEEGAIGGTSPDQKVQRRKNSKSGKRVKKRKSKGMVLHAIGEENEQIESENDSMMPRLQLMQDDMEMQKTEFCASQNKIIAAQEICVETLYQKLQLMGGSDRLDAAPSKGNQSLDGITELKHRSMLNTKNIDLLCEMLLK